MGILHHSQAQYTNLLHHLTLSKLIDLAEPTRKIDDYRSHCLIHTQQKLQLGRNELYSGCQFLQTPPFLSGLQSTLK